MLRFPRLCSARLAAELAEIRDTAARAEARADEILSRMQEQTAAAGLPRPRTRPALRLVSTDERVPARTPRAAGRHAFHYGQVRS